ncbi:MAG: hypothetical protein EBU90_24745 [Proteobacteria bacterium]|nr:hypothetical protein [Pseudomonadota bacterium]
MARISGTRISGTKIGGTFVPSPPGFQGSNFGYTSGGGTPAASNVIDKFPFATNANATDVGDLTVARRFPAGQQYL